MNRRIYLTAVGTSVASLAGCAGPGDSGRATTAAPVDTGLVASHPGPYPHDIRVENTRGRPVQLTLTVERDDALLYRKTHEVTPGSDAVIAGFVRETLPPDERTVRITVETADGATQHVEVSITDCLGNVVVFFDESGDLQLTYSIC